MVKIIQLRERCIGCAVCCEIQPDLWCMSKKDGKATLIRSILKRHASILNVMEDVAETTQLVAVACPVNIIKVLL